MPHHLRRVSALAAAALTTGALTLTPIGAAHAATAPNAAVEAAIGWLEAQLVDGGLPSSYGGTNTGATIDAAMSLLAVDPSADVSAETSAVAAGLQAGYADSAEYGCPTPGDYSCDPSAYVFLRHGYYANATAKALVFAEAVNATPTSFGGRDLVTQLQDRVQSNGKIADDSSWGEYANVFGQAFAARGLTEAVARGVSGAGSEQAANVTSYLLAQQCPDGSFPEQFDGCGTGSSVDATATVVLQLQAETSPSDDVTAAVTKANTWLASMQHADGAWSTDASAGGDNANSTGLSGWALGAGGNSAAALRAAAWVRAHQLANVGACAPYAAGSLGALAFDDAARTLAVTSGTATDQFRVTASQAIPVLGYATAGGTLGIAGPTGAQQPGAKATYAISGAAPGEAVCVTAPGAVAQAVTADATGVATVTFTLPASGTSYPVTATSASASATASTTIAAPAPAPSTSTPGPSVRAPKKAHRGDKVKVVVHGLISGEKVKVTIRGEKVGHGKARADGTFKVKFKLKGKRLIKLGKAKIKVVGVTSGVVASTTVKVVR